MRRWAAGAANAVYGAPAPGRDAWDSAGASALRRPRRWNKSYRDNKLNYSRVTWTQDPLSLRPDNFGPSSKAPQTKPYTKYGEKRAHMRRAVGAGQRNLFTEKEMIAAPRRDDFWRWGTTHIERIPVLQALLNRMLPRRYHKWYEDTTYEHHWVGADESEDGETTELYILVKYRGNHVVPSVLKFRMKEMGAGEDIKIMIDYHRVETNYLHRWPVMVARDAMTRLIMEMDDWYEDVKAEEIALLGEGESARLDGMLPATMPTPSTTPPRFKKVSGVEPSAGNALATASGARWGAGLRRYERQTPEAAMYDPRTWDTKPLRPTVWPIPRVDHELPQLRDRASGKNTHL